MGAIICASVHGVVGCVLSSLQLPLCLGSLTLKRSACIQGITAKADKSLCVTHWLRVFHCLHGPPRPQRFPSNSVIGFAKMGYEVNLTRFAVVSSAPSLWRSPSVNSLVLSCLAPVDTPGSILSTASFRAEGHSPTSFPAPEAFSSPLW